MDEAIVILDLEQIEPSNEKALAYALNKAAGLPSNGTARQAGLCRSKTLRFTNRPVLQLTPGIKK